MARVTCRTCDHFARPRRCHNNPEGLRRAGDRVWITIRHPDKYSCDRHSALPKTLTYHRRVEPAHPILVAIRFKCFECMGAVLVLDSSGRLVPDRRPYSAVRECADTSCPFYYFRLGTNPNRGKSGPVVNFGPKEAIEKLCRQCGPRGTCVAEECVLLG